jgi:hypothetical protein
MRRTVFALAFLASTSLSFAADRLTGGDGTMYLGGRPNRIFLIDEATEKVVDEIQCKTGLPMSLQLSEDRKRFYVESVSFEDFEIIDLASRKSVDTFRISEGNKRVRVLSFAADPLNRFLILETKTATKLQDRFETSSTTLLQYDLSAHKVTRTIPWPDGQDHEFMGLHFSPDGKLLYLFGDDVLILETTDFKVVDKWDLSRHYESGFGRISVNTLRDLSDALGDPSNELNEEPGFITSLFTVPDAVNNRRIMGVARVNLGQKSMDFYALGPEAPVSFTLAPGRKWGYGLYSDIGKYEFWSFDLANRRIDRRIEFQGRPRMSVKVSTNGKLLYIYEAGNTIDVFDAASFKYLRTITLDADMTTDLFVMRGK